MYIQNFRTTSIWLDFDGVKRKTAAKLDHERSTIHEDELID